MKDVPQAADSGATPVAPEVRLEDGEPVLREARFDRRFIAYSMISTTIVLFITCIGIVVLPIYLAFASWLHGRQLARMRFVLTERSLKVERGIWNRIEKTIPLDKITDLALYQGPIMRAFDLQGLRVETAGQSAPAGAALVTLVGVIDARGFRQAVLAQRDAVVGGAGKPTVVDIRAATSVATADAEGVLHEIRDALLRIEKRLEQR